MRFFKVLPMGLLLFSGMVCVAEEERKQEEQRKQAEQEQRTEATPPPLSSLPNSEEISLKDAPMAVQDRIINQAAVAPLQSLTRATLDGTTIYEAKFEGGNTETTLQLTQSGRPIGLFMRSTGEGVDEAAGAQRGVTSYSPPPAPPGAQQLPPGAQQTLQKLGPDQIESIVYEINYFKDGQLQQLRYTENPEAMKQEGQQKQRTP